MESVVNKDNFFNEISLMMHGFGDSPTPNTETVQLVENIVRKQLREMLSDITVKNSEKTYRTITIEDIIFYLRKSTQKVQRLFKYIQCKYQTCKPVMDYEMENPKKLTFFNSVKAFIECIDETGELLDTTWFDTVKHSRELRAARLSSALDEQKYYEYAKARAASFNLSRFSRLHNTQRFNKWLDPQNDFNLKNETIELLSFLAYGIVANITDMALIIRENNSYMINDPVEMKVGHYHNSMMFNVPHITWNNSIHVNKGQAPISVNEIYEVCRRCYMPQVGYMRFSNKSILGKRRLCY